MKRIYLMKFGLMWTNSRNLILNFNDDNDDSSSRSTNLCNWIFKICGSNMQLNMHFMQKYAINR